MSGTNSPVGGGGSFMGGVYAFAGVAVVAVLIGGAWYLLPKADKNPPVAQSGAGARQQAAEWREPPRPPPQPEPPRAEARPVGNNLPLPPREAVRSTGRPRPSSMALYDVGETAREAAVRKAREAKATPAEDAREQKIAGMAVQRAEVVEDGRFFLMPGDKIPCNNLEPTLGREGAEFSASIPTDVRGRDGEETLLPAGSRVFGKIVRGLERDGYERVGAILTHAEAPTTRSRRMVVVPLGSPAADAMGQPDLEGNVNTHFGKRLLATAAYAGLDLVSSAGGAIAGAAIADAVRGAGGTGVGIYNLRGLGRGLAGREYETQMNQRPSFERPQGQACTVHINKPIDFRDAVRKRKSA